MIRIRITISVLVAVAWTALLATGAMAQASYPAGAGVTCDSSVAAPGSSITCSAGGFAPGTEVKVEATGTADDGAFNVTTTVVANANGVASATIKIPSNASQGPVSVVFSGEDSNGNFVRVASGTFTVQAAPAGSGSGSGATDGDSGTGSGGLARTGGEITIGAALAASLLVVGAAFLLVARRRSNHDVHAG